MSTHALVYIAFTILTLGLMYYIVRLRHLRNQQARCHQERQREQLDLIERYVRIVQSQDEYIRELSVQLEAASECANEYRTELRDIDNQLQCDPIQFLFTNEEIHHG